MARGMSNLCGRSSSRRGRSKGRSKCLKPGPIGRNPYLNFLRQFRKQHCGLSAVKTIQAGAKEWKRLSKEEKLKYISEAFYAPKRRRHMSSAMCGPRGRSTTRRSSRRRRVC